MSFRDPDGAPAVARVDRVADHHAGARAGQLPDLVVQWSARPATRLAGVSSTRFGDVARRGTGSGRSGNHTPGDAWAVVAPGAYAPRTPDAGRAPRLADVAATVAAVRRRRGRRARRRVAAGARSLRGAQPRARDRSRPRAEARSRRRAGRRAAIAAGARSRRRAAPAR